MFTRSSHNFLNFENNFPCRAANMKVLQVTFLFPDSSLKTIFVAGEFCDYETKAWAEKVFKVPILNNWWQSETGHPITALCLGYGHYPNLPKFSTGLPMPGYNSESSVVSSFFCVCLLSHFCSMTLINSFNLRTNLSFACESQTRRSTVQILRDDGSIAPERELGRIAIQLPLPPGCMLTLYRAPEKFKEVYFSSFPVSDWTLCL